MALYFLSYDLRKKRDYKALYNELEKFHAVAVLDSLYSFKRDNTTHSEIKDHFRNFIDEDDGLIVIEAKAWAVHNVDNSPPKF